MKYLVRLISSSEHNVSKEELINKIKKTGTDRYNPERKQIFDDYYSKFQVDFFATECQKNDLEHCIHKSLTEFPTKTLGDRKYAVKPDIVIIYDSSKCEMIPNVYPKLQTSDCYRFKDSPKDAFLEVRAYGKS